MQFHLLTKKNWRSIYTFTKILHYSWLVIQKVNSLLSPTHLPRHLQSCASCFRRAGGNPAKLSELLKSKKSLCWKRMVSDINILQKLHSVDKFLQMTPSLNDSIPAVILSSKIFFLNLKEAMVPPFSGLGSLPRPGLPPKTRSDCWPGTEGGMMQWNLWPGVWWHPSAWEAVSCYFLVHWRL